MVEDNNLIRVDHVDEEELVAFCLKESKHFRVRQSGNGKIEAPSKNPFLLGARDQVGDIVGDELFVEIAPQHGREFIQHFLKERNRAAYLGHVAQDKSKEQQRTEDRERGVRKSSRQLRNH